MDFAHAYLEDVRKLARTYKGLADDAIAQVDDAAFATVLGGEENSIALIVKHMAGNLRSRWTDFFSTDGEKPDRERDAEFELHGADGRAALLEAWEGGWATFLGVLDSLTPDDFDRPVTIRGEPYTVIRAVQRGVAHACYHVGQIVLLAKHFAGPEWRTLSIPRGQSRTYDPLAPTPGHPVNAPPPLRLLSLDDAGIGLDDVIVRPRSSGMLMVGVMALGMAGWSVWSAARGGLSWPWAAVIVLALGWIARVGFRTWQRTQSPGAWQMAIGRDRVLIRFRGVMAAGSVPGEAQVIEVPLADVAWVRRMRRTVQQMSGKERTRTTYEYLDLRVKDRDLRPLQAVLADEAWDAAQSWFRRREPTVAVTCDGVLRVETSFQASGTRPALDEILRLLGERVPREEDARENVDLTNPAALSPVERDDAVRAVGETNPHRAWIIARDVQPGVPADEVQRQVARLIACPDPTAAPAEPEPIAHLAVDALEPDPDPAAPLLPAPRLLRGDEVRFVPGDHVVRPRSRALGSLLFFLAVAALVAWRWQAGALRGSFAALLGVPAVVFAWFLLGMWLATFRRDAWLLAITGEGVLVRFRSYLHYRFPAADPVVLELPFASLAGVRRTVQTRVSPSSSGSGTQQRKHTLLDLRVRGLDLGPLAEALSRERGLSQQSFAYKHAPVAVDGDLVRIEVSSRDDATRPADDEVLRLLAQHVPREHDVAEVVESGGPRGRSRTITAPETQG